jgi:hypothetical protein
MKPRLPDRVGREVVVVHVAALLLEGEVVDALPLLRGAERERRQDLRLAAREQAGAVRARVDADLDRDRTDVLRSAAVRAALLDRDLLPDEVLVDRVGGPLHVLLRELILHRRRVAFDRRGPDRERQLRRLDDPVVEERPLRGLELLRVLLGLRQRAQVVLELVADRPLRGLEPLPLEQQGRAPT